MQPSLAATILTDLDSHAVLRSDYRRQGYLTINQVGFASLLRDPTTTEARGIGELLKRTGWTKKSNGRYVAPKDHPIHLAAEVPGLTDQAMDWIRLLVGRSGLPEEYHAECIQQIVQGSRAWVVTRPRIYYVINKMKKNLSPLKESDEDIELRNDIMQWLEDPDTQRLIASRPQRYVTPWEVIEGTMRIPDTKMFRDLARVMPWEKTTVRVGDSVINAYVQPTSEPRKAPDLAELLTYLQDRVVAVENVVLRDVAKLAARQVQPSDRAHLRQAMRALGWKRERSLYGEGWIYIKKESM